MQEEPFIVKAAGLEQKISVSTNKGFTEYYFRISTGRDSQRVTSRDKTDIIAKAKTFLEGKAMGKAVDPSINATVHDYYRQCEAMLPKGVTLKDAVNFYLLNHTTSKFTKTVEEIVEEFYAAKEATKRSDNTDRYSKAYMSQLRHCLKVRLVDRWGHRPLSSITAEEYQTWFANKIEFASPGSADCVKRAIRAMSNWAQKRGYLDATIKPSIVAADTPEAELTEPGIILPRVLEELLVRSVRGRDQRLTATIALKSFCGIRDSEVQRIRWDQVDFEERAIFLGRKSTKTRYSRRIEITDQVYGFLKHAYDHRQGGTRNRRCVDRVALPNHYGAMRALCYGSPNDEHFELEDNGMRHSFVSYSIVSGADPSAVALQAGHSKDVAKTNYTTNVRKIDAKAFFAITIEGVVAKAKGLEVVAA